jgi:hypothetical protein
MAGTTEIIAEAQERFLGAIREAQDTVVGAVRTWAEVMQKAAGALPTLPVGEDLPPLSKVVDDAYGFAERLLQAQREFTKGLLEAWTPVLEVTKEKARKQAKAS